MEFFQLAALFCRVQQLSAKTPSVGFPCMILVRRETQTILVLLELCSYFLFLFSSVVKIFSQWPYLFLSLHLSLFLVFVSFVEKSLVSFAWGSRPGVDGVGAQHLQVDGVGQVGVLRPGAPTTTP